MSERLLITSNVAIATVTLNRPELHNAFDEALIGELTDTFTRLGADPEIRVIVVTGAGSSFCAGADLDWMRRMAGYSRAENVEDARTLQRMFAAIYDCPKVTIARVNGAAMGGGAGLVAACDIAIAAEEAKFGFTEVRLGLAPAVISPYVLQKIGPGAARALFVTGERFDAEEARRIGLVQAVVPADDLDTVVEEKGKQVLQAGPQAIAASKQLLRDIADKTPAEAADRTVHAIADLRVGSEGQEGIRAFLEKRKPDFGRRD
jgi:methylglutaconyl-CoA hydratase